jgi:glycosyltransferase involved in cell wall biosynthesis
VPPADERPMVSVIVIFLNAERFIREALDSVLRQSLTSWELLLVDDGSTDASTEFAKCCATEYPGRVRYLEHPGHINRGMSATRNLGVRHAAGDFIAFLDSDDVWLPEKLETQVAIMLAHPEVGMVCGAAKYWASWDRSSGQSSDVVVPTGGPQDCVSYPPSLLLDLYPLGAGASPCPSDLMLRRDALMRVKGFEEHFVGPYQLYEDQAFLAKLYLCTPIYISSSIWLLYRRHPDSCVASVRKEGKYREVRGYFLTWLGRYLADGGCLDDAVLQALERALRPYKHPSLFWRLENHIPLLQTARRMASSLLRRSRTALEKHRSPDVRA